MLLVQEVFVTLVDAFPLPDLFGVKRSNPVFDLGNWHRKRDFLPVILPITAAITRDLSIP